MPRLRAPRDPVTLTLDGRPVVAEKGEPAVVALLAAGHWALARSPKFHRPRGPFCLRGGCDGCLARVDGMPNVMTCRTPAAEGMCIETQNVVGSRETDLLRVGDWLFPRGMNPHELAAGVPGLQRITRALARRVAGLGRLPARTRALATAERRAVDALVVGAGPAGMAAAVELSGRGRAVEVVDDDVAWGGCLHALLLPGGTPAAQATAWKALARRFADAVASGVRLRLRTTALGIYGDDVVLVSEDPGEPPPVAVVTARTLVLAPGAHDGVIPFEGNDVPGILSARAGCRLLAAGVAPGHRVAVACARGAGSFGRLYARVRPESVLIEGEPVKARGRPRVAEVVARTADGERRVACDALLVDAPRAPSYELCVQAGAQVTHEERGYLVHTGRGGQIRPGVYAVGEAIGAALDPQALCAEARALPAL